MCHTFMFSLLSFIKNMGSIWQERGAPSLMESEGKLWKPLRLTVRGLTGRVTGGTKGSVLWVLTFKLSWANFTLKGTFSYFEGGLSGKVTLFYLWMTSVWSKEFIIMADDRIRSVRIKILKNFSGNNHWMYIWLTFGGNHIQDVCHS